MHSIRENDVLKRIMLYLNMKPNSKMGCEYDHRTEYYRTSWRVARSFST